jgi:hypothetical protein
VLVNENQRLVDENQRLINHLHVAAACNIRPSTMKERSASHGAGNLNKNHGFITPFKTPSTRINPLTVISPS